MRLPCHLTNPFGCNIEKPDFRIIFVTNKCYKHINAIE
jgi:hypothetical protein